MQATLPLTAAYYPFVADVLATDPRVVAFDCDGTLWHGDAGEDFFLWSIGRGLAQPRRAKQALLVWEQYRVALAGEEEVWRALAGMYAGTPVESLRAAADEFVEEHILPRVYPEMRALLEALAARRVEVWAVSASNEWVIEAACARLGIVPKHVLATSVAVEDGCATSRVGTVPTDQGKVRVLREHGVSVLDCAFGNTVHDFEMMTLARTAFAINPEPALAQIARTWRWKVQRLG
jgi:phosphoserine phosphatase